MAKDPAVLFYAGDFFMGTVSMTDEQVGRYIRALCLQHNEHLKDSKFKEIVHNDPELIEKFDKDEKGLWYNKRWEFEKDRRQKYLDSRNVAPAHAVTRAKSEAKKTAKAEELQKLAAEQIPPEVKDEEYAPPVYEPRFKPPTIKDVQKQIDGMGYKTVSAEVFITFYESKGWMVGKNKMKDWKQALAGWESRNKQRHEIPEKGTHPGQKMDTGSVEPTKF